MRTVILGLALLGSCFSGVADAAAPTDERDERMQWWRDARFGMFVHWGLYSGLAGTWDGKPVGETGGMEWIQNRVRADTDTYFERARPLFVPTPGLCRVVGPAGQGGGLPIPGVYDETSRWLRPARFEGQ